MCDFDPYQDSIEITWTIIRVLRNSIQYGELLIKFGVTVTRYKSTNIINSWLNKGKFVHEWE